MRIILVTTCYPPPYGGIHVVARNLAEDLVLRGHHVRLLNFDGANTSNYRRLKPRDFFYTAATRNHYYRLSHILNPFYIFKKGGFREFVHYNLIYRLTQHNIHTFAPDIVHILSPKLYTAVYDCPTPFVVTCHSEELKDDFPTIYVLKHAARIHCVSRYTEQLVVNLNNDVKDKIVVIYNSVALVPTSEDQVTEDRSFILSVGRLVKPKNFANIIKAYALLDPVVRSHHNLVIVGVGPEEGSLVALAERLHLGDGVCFRGMVSEEEKAILLGKTRVFVLCPTRYQQEEEGFGIVFIEAQARGVPVVGSMIGGVPEAVGKGGVLVQNERNPCEIRDAVERVLFDERTYVELRELALENVKRFDRQEWVPQFEALYEVAVNDVARVPMDDVV